MSSICYLLTLPRAVKVIMYGIYLNLGLISSKIRFIMIQMSISIQSNDPSLSYQVRRAILHYCNQYMVQALIVYLS